MSNDARAVYVSPGATVEEVSAAVATYLSTAGLDIEAHVEFGNEYSGYVTAIDIYAATDEDALAAAATLAAGIEPLLPGSLIATDLELQSRDLELQRRSSATT